MTELALFPLSQVVLPNGQMKLRVFEARYQRLVSESCAGQRDFAIALLNPYVTQQHPDRIFSVATQVRITDFSRLDDGLLGITISGVQRVQINRRWQEQDGLHVATVIALAPWESCEMQPEYQLLSQELQHVFADNPLLKELYPTPAWQDPVWLAQRWIEILSMQPPLKYQLMAADNANPTLEALTHWLNSEQADC